LPTGVVGILQQVAHPGRTASVFTLDADPSQYPRGFMPEEGIFEDPAAILF